MRAIALATLLCGFCEFAHPRDADGRLGLVLAPSNTQPAIVLRGEGFDVVLRGEVALRLESASGSYPLSVAPARRVRGFQHTRATPGADVPPGTYTLIAKSLSVEESNFRSVVVLDAPQETYRVAVWSNLRVGADPHSPDSALFRLTAQINAGNAALVLVTGDLTAAGSPEQFRLALELLNDCTAPTLVVPGPTDVASGRVQEYLGRYPLAVTFGLDAYLLCPPPVGSLGGEAGRLHLERRRVRAARWSIGAGMSIVIGDLRDPLTVFVDDPLDVVIGGLDAAAEVSAERSVWGGARIFLAPADRAALQWFTVRPRGVSPDRPAD